jgi:hypothetical protein
MISKAEQLSEFAKCLVDIPYAIRTYLETFDQTQEKYVPFNLFPRQAEAIQLFDNNRFNLVSKYRQAGMTTTLSAFFAIKVSFHGDPERPEKILILANKQETAQEVLQKVKEFLNQVPRWVWGQEYVDDITKSIYITDSKKHLVLPNKCQIKALATSKDALRGYTPTILMMDEAAHIDDGAETFGAALAAMSTGGKIILNSTPNGLDPLYYKVYDNARTGKNKFKVIQMYWYEDPRYNKGLKWTKEGEEPIQEKEFTIESYKQMIDSGWSPTSHWYEEMCSNYNGNTKLIAQELDCSFIGSGGNVIDEEHIEYQEKENVKFPIRFEGREEECWIWEEPQPGVKYIMGVDVSRGDSEDFSVIEIINTDTMEQALEWVGKIQPDLLSELVLDYGNRYNAYTVVDITGGMGVTTVLKLMEMEYKLLHFDDPRSRILSNRKDISKFKSNENKIPGFNVGAFRLNMVAEFEKVVRTGEFKIRSHRVISEMKTFIYINGRPDHMKGYHDDCIMSIAMCLFVLQHSFKNLEKVNNQTRAILNSWVANTPGSSGTFIQEAEQNSQNNVMPVIPTTNQMSNQPNDYRQYSWLFGGGR